MSKEKNIGKRAKNSNSFATPQIPEVTEEIVLTPDTTLSLTICEPGAFQTRKPNAASKKELKLMKRSWVYSKTKKGEWQSPNGLPLSEYMLNTLREKYKVKVDKNTKPGQWRPLKEGQKPKNYYESNSKYVSPEYHSCVRKMNIGTDALFFYVSSEACPYRGKNGQKLWDSLSLTQRLLVQLELTAGTNQFTYKLIN